ncbi:MAG: PorV/PorQ family protein [Gemmatimonadetes bacterium]|nr:PorV/PorQ family protein [Gemmatimonadota bacterium]
MRARRHIRNTLFAVTAVALLCPAAVRAQSKTGTTIGQFLLIEPSARISAMGNAGVALYDGIQSIYYNPAAAGQLTRYELQVTHSEWLAGINYDYVALGVPIESVGNFFLSVTSLHSGDIDVRTVGQPLGTGERFTVENLALGVGYGRQFTPRFGAGIQANYVEETVWHTSLRTWTIGAGTAYRFPGGLRLGSSISHFGTRAGFGGRDLRIQYDADPDVFGDNSALPAEQFADDFAVPILFRVGVTMPRELSPNSMLLVSVDAFHPNDNKESVSFGTEWTWNNTLALRAGYQDLFLEDSEVGLTLGVGIGGRIDLSVFDFDYVWADHGRLDATHRFTFALGF